MLFTVPAHILMTHPHLIFISPRFLLHPNLCQEGLLQVVKSEKVDADGLRGHFSPKLFCTVLRENVKDFFEVSCAAGEHLLNCYIEDEIIDHEWIFLQRSGLIHVLLYSLMVLQAEDQFYWTV